MYAIVSSDITIYNPTFECRKRYKEMLTFPNPEFVKKERMGFWTGNTPRVVSLIAESAEWIKIPFGLLYDVFANRNEYETIVNDVKLSSDRVDYESYIRTYDYQEEAVEAALEGRNGVIVAPCASGKTQMGLEIIARLGLRALWLTHTGDLLKQSLERAKAVLGIDPATFGTITDGKINIGASITFATVQTMCKIDLAAVKHEWDVIIVDEAHHIVGTPTKLQMFYKVISGLCARYKFGLTATPKRSDGLIACMYALLGQKLYEVTKTQIKDNLCPVRVFTQHVDFEPDLSVILAPDGTLQFTSLINNLTESESRNRQIVEDIAKHSGSGKRGLVLTDRVQHIETLSKALSARGLRCVPLHGSVKKTARESAIVSLKAGNIDLIIASFALAKEGLDIPNLDNVFFTTPQKNETVVVQSAGRVARIAEGKAWGNVYDYVDDFALLRSWAAKRRKCYLKCDYVIDNPTSDLL